MTTPETLQPGPLERVQLRDVARGTLVVLLVVLAFALTLMIREALITIFLGVLLATALAPVVGRLRDGWLPRHLAAAGAVLLLVGSGVGAVVGLAPMVVAQAAALAQQLPRAYDALRGELAGSPYRVVQAFGAQLPPRPPVERTALAETLVREAWGWLPQVSWWLFGTLAVLAFTYYWLLYRNRSIRGLLLLLPMEQRDGAEQVWLRIEDKIGAFLRGQALLALATGGLSLLGYWLVGTPYFLLMALIAGLLELIPFIGPFIAGAIAVGAAFSISPAAGLGTLVVAAIVQQLENIFLAPRIMDEAVGVSPVVTLLAFAGFAALFGLAGALLAIPLAAVLQVLFNEWMQRRAGAAVEEPVQGRSLADRLRYQARDLAQDLAGLMRAKQDEASGAADEVEEAIEQVLTDLEELLDRAEEGRERALDEA
ncbi:MAG TPA: AI-2E family transporter [Roseiflexaceae bacterium]|nr:AI-2E family transporter [Roseiflexaceae bacterium]